METKEELIKTIKEWVKMDNDIRKISKELTARKNEKKKLSVKLLDTMKQNEIDCFDINDGQICYTKKNIKKIPIYISKLVKGVICFYKHKFYVKIIE